MVDDLLADHSPIGRPVAEIDELLGPGRQRARHGLRARLLPERDRVWWLGDERGFIRIDSEWLVLRVDARATVTEARVVRD